MNETPARLPELRISIVAQSIRRLPGTYTVTSADLPANADSARLVTVSVAGEHTVVEESGNQGDWIALYTGGTAHDLDTPGMTVSVIAPLSAAGIPIFVASTSAADLVLIPASALESALSCLTAVGHTLIGE